MFLLVSLGTGVPPGSQNISQNIRKRDMQKRTPKERTWKEKALQMTSKPTSKLQSNRLFAKMWDVFLEKQILYYLSPFYLPNDCKTVTNYSKHCRISRFTKSRPQIENIIRNASMWAPFSRHNFTLFRTIGPKGNPGNSKSTPKCQTKRQQGAARVPQGDPTKPKCHQNGSPGC